LQTHGKEFREKISSVQRDPIRQALSGYIDAKSGRPIAFFVTVDNVPITGIPDVLTVFQDKGTIAAMLWGMQ
jgi:D-alanyl-D-alanine carboxypeptidase